MRHTFLNLQFNILLKLSLYHTVSFTWQINIFFKLDKQLLYKLLKRNHGQTNNKMKEIKKKTVIGWDKEKYGSSIGQAPNQVNKRNVVTILQKRTWYIKLKLTGTDHFTRPNGKKYNTKTEKAKAMTPPNLEGIDRKIA